MTEKAAHVIEALCRVMADLPGIGKEGQAAASQGGYKYRGIEQITAETQTLFARHGIVFVPRVVSWEIREIIVAGKPWTDTIEEVAYDVYGPGGVNDCITVGPILAIGRDNSDKGANKCLTQAFKYALIQALSIGDGKDDADGTTHEADAPRPPARLRLSPASVDNFLKACEEAGVDPADVVGDATDRRTDKPVEVYADEADALRDALKRAKPTVPAAPEGAAG